MLKEKGFNLPCFTTYDKDGLLDNYWDLSNEEFVYDQTINNVHTQKRNAETELVCAPLWQQAVDWLREKKNIHITNMESGGNHTFQVKQYVNGVSNVCYVPSLGHYYVGLNQAIITCINLIP